MKKYRSLLVISVLLLGMIAANAAVYVWVFRFLRAGRFAAVIVLLSLVFLTLALLYVIRERYLEIKKGYEDDLDQY